MSDLIKLKPVFKNTIFMGGGDYQQGFEDGKNAGYNDGFNSGKTEGLEEGFDNGYSEGLNEGYANGVEFGKQNAPTENLNVTLTSNGSYSYPKPNDKYYADVAINVSVPSEKTPTQEKSVTITKNGTEVISPDDGYALSKVTVTTNIDTRLPEQEKSLEVTENKTYEVTPDDGYALKKVTVTGNVASSGGGDDSGQLAKISTFNADEWNVADSTQTYFISLIKNIDWTEFNKKKHKNFEYFFRYYYGTNLDVSNLDTSNATNFSYMFHNSSLLTNLDLSNWNTSNVTTMKSMFHYCSALTSLDVSNFDTSNVTTMKSMFHECNKLFSIDVSNWNTRNVTHMDSMFYYCYALTSLDVSNFDTSNVTSCSGMFGDCISLENITFAENWMSNRSVVVFEVKNSPLSKASILDLANKIADKSDKSVYTGTYKVLLKSSQKSLFTADELTALANQFTAKNWTLAWS